MATVRGGRDRERQEQEAASVEAARVRQKEQLSADLRNLLPLAPFQRYLQHLMRKCGTFDSTEVLTAEAYRIAARRHVGAEIAKELGDADRKAAALLMAQMLYDTLEPQE
jgi:hypothetical protein